MFNLTLILWSSSVFFLCMRKPRHRKAKSLAQGHAVEEDWAGPWIQAVWLQSLSVLVRSVFCCSAKNRSAWWDSVLCRRVVREGFRRRGRKLQVEWLEEGRSLPCENFEEKSQPKGIVKYKGLNSRALACYRTRKEEKVWLAPSKWGRENNGEEIKGVGGAGQGLDVTYP